MATFLMTMAMSICGFLVGFSRGWKLSLVVLATVPALIFGAFMFSYNISEVSKRTANAYAEAGGKAE